MTAPLDALTLSRARFACTLIAFGRVAVAETSDEIRQAQEAWRADMAECDAGRVPAQDLSRLAAE